MAKKNDKKKKPEVHKDLEGFTMRVNEFGQIVVSNLAIEDLNEFLDKNVPDKKLDNELQITDEEE